jgi:hypothetical protein
MALRQLVEAAFFLSAMDKMAQYPCIAGFTGNSFIYIDY